MDRALLSAPVASAATRPHIGAVLHCEGPPPSLERLAAHVVARLPRVPALRSVPAGSRWRVEAGLDLEAHVVERRLEPGPAPLEAAVGELIGSPLPEGGPAWRLHLLHGRTGDGFALLYRVHHALQDGGGMLHTLEALFADDADAPSSAVYPGFAAPARASLRDFATGAGALLGGALRAGSWASLPAGFSAEREHRWCEVPVDLLRGAARRHGASVNDAFLAALAHALAPAAAPPRVPFLVPVNLRRPGEEAAPGNRVVLASVALPGGERGAAGRLGRAPGATGALKSAGVREAVRRVTALTPAAVMTGMLKAVSRPARSATLASNLPLRRRLGFQGAPVVRVAPVMWAPLGVPAAALMLTYRGTAAVCFTTDPAMPGLDGLRDRWRAAVESWG
nr:wax ester/triacylglycerol synthase family O-acyltransferase [Glycomyces amatae]